MWCEVLLAQLLPRDQQWRRLRLTVICISAAHAARCRGYESAARDEQQITVAKDDIKAPASKRARARFCDSDLLMHEDNQSSHACDATPANNGTEGLASQHATGAYGKQAFVGRSQSPLSIPPKSDPPKSDTPKLDPPASSLPPQSCCEDES